MARTMSSRSSIRRKKASAAAPSSPANRQIPRRARREANQRQAKRAENKYQDNYEKWQDEKKIDPKAVRPKKPSIKRLKQFKTKEVADEYKQQLEDELAKKESDKPKR